MSIETELNKLQTNLSNAYTSCESKGATMPSSQNFDNLSTTIDSIETGGGGGGTKYGLSIDNIIGNVDANGVLQQPTENTDDIVFNGIVEIKAADTLAYKCYKNKALKNGVSFPDLTTIGTSGCQYMFSGCTGITSVDLSALTTLKGDYGCERMFSDCSGIVSVDFSSLTSISNYNTCNGMFSACSEIKSLTFPALTTIAGTSSCASMFRVCTGITSVSFPVLTSVNGYNIFNYFLYGCTSLTDVYFNSLTRTSFGPSYTNQFTNMLQNTGTSTTHTIHFPSNLESTVSGLTGYPNFGGTSGSVVLAFDLPATS